MAQDEKGGGPIAGFWVGADPGGRGNFGLAFLDRDSGVRCVTVSSVDEAAERIRGAGEPRGMGIDAPMWWSSAEGGQRAADRRVRHAIRHKCPSPSGTVQAANSLRGAAIVGGAMLALRVRQAFPRVPITESHPKALLFALEVSGREFADRYGIPPAWKNEHERDAAIAAVCAREGFNGRRWVDLALDRYDSEVDPGTYWLAPMSYFWPVESHSCPPT